MTDKDRAEIAETVGELKDKGRIPLCIWVPKESGDVGTTIAGLPVVGRFFDEGWMVEHTS